MTAARRPARIPINDRHPPHRLAVTAAGQVLGEMFCSLLDFMERRRPSLERIARREGAPLCHLQAEILTICIEEYFELREKKPPRRRKE